MAGFRRHASLFRWQAYGSFAGLLVVLLLNLGFQSNTTLLVMALGFTTFIFAYLTLASQYTYDRMVARVLGLLHQWERDTVHLSFTDRENLLYRKIISLGEPVVPILLKELKTRTCHVFSMLGEITGENPVDRDHCGKINAMREDWLAWGREKGYI